MNEFDKTNPVIPTASASAQAVSAQRVFLGKSHAGRFVVTRVEQTPPRRESHVPGIFIVPFRITLDVTRTLPELENRRFVLQGSKGEGVESGALGLQDWLPTTIGDEVVLAFDPKQMEDASQVVFLGAGTTLEVLWSGVEQFHKMLQDRPVIDPGRVANALGQTSPPGPTFFSLLYNYDKSVYQNANVVRALGVYLGNRQLSASDRRTIVAHYLDAPGHSDAEALRELLRGMLRLVIDLSASGNATSASVVLQRIFGYAFDSRSGEFLAKPPDLAGAELVALEQILISPNAGLSEDACRSLRTWITSTKRK